MRVGSTFSGVGGFDLGLHRAGHGVAFQVESDPYRRAVLARHWADVPRYDDVRTFDGEPWRGRIDMLAGGFPCQDVSVAGQRAGLAGERSGLFFEFARIARDAIGPGGFILIENVAGLLSNHDGRDFAVVLATLAESGFHDLAWRIVDSQYFGVPQRRRRVFILGRRGIGRSSAAILLDPESGGGDFAARRPTPARATHRTSGGIARARTGSGKRYDGDTDDFIIANTVKSRNGGGRTNDDASSYWIEDFRNGTLTADPGRTDRKPIVIGPALDAHGMRAATGLPGRLDDPSGERTDPKPDGRRYAAVGDAVTVNVAAWIGRRLALFEAGEL
jgi:DNA (cytosine-5)-methyltransferase 1